MGVDFSIHHSGGITSKVGDATGRVVTTTAFGSRYKLLNARSELLDALRDAGVPFNPEDPLADPPALIQAWQRAAAAGAEP